MRTFAEALGGTPHVSPLLRKTRRLGFGSTEALLALAARRGCTHYAPANVDIAQVKDPGREQLSDLELAFALCSGSQRYDPMLVRCAAQLISGPTGSAADVARMAHMERSEAIIAHIASAALALDSGYESYWRAILNGLRVRRPAPAGVLPDRSRFALQTGIFNPRRPRPRSVWLRRPAAIP